MRNRIRLMAVPLVAALLASLGLSPAAADTGELRPNATSAINWLIEQTNDDGSLSSYGTEPDMGLTLDAALAGMVVGTSREVIDGWIDAAEPHVAKVATDNGRVAKVVLTLAAAGRSTTDFGGINPQDLVRKSVTASGYTTGHSEGTNAFGQSLAMIAMARTGELPASTVSFLVGQQCSNGGFPMYFATDATGHCDAVNTIPDPDGTAMVIMALRAGEAKGISGAGASLTKAVAWMKAQQKPNGAFTGHPTFTPSENTNSSGLVAGALADLEPAVTAKTGQWVSGLQIKAGENAGAVAYDKAAFDAAKGTISRVGKGQWVRSTAQAVFAFAPIDLYRLVPRYERKAPYTLAGEHSLNGRQWRTTCEPYSQTERCRTEIWATTVLIENGRFVRKDAWVFNNLTYLPFLTEAAWQGNPLASHNMSPGFTSAGRQWRTECHTEKTGRGACRSYTLSTVYKATPRSSGGYTFTQGEGWVFNNIVMFGDPATR